MAQPLSAKAHAEGKMDVIMLTADGALAVDPEYRKYVEAFVLVKDKEAYLNAFANTQYKLTNSNMGSYN
jgi:catalase (peroxidase I)